EATAPFTALRASGRLMVRMATRPRVSYPTMGRDPTRIHHVRDEDRYRRSHASSRPSSLAGPPPVPVLPLLRGGPPVRRARPPRRVRVRGLRRLLGRGHAHRQVPRSLPGVVGVRAATLTTPTSAGSAPFTQGWVAAGWPVRAIAAAGVDARGVRRRPQLGGRCRATPPARARGARPGGQRRATP